MENLLLARVKDALRLCKLTSSPKFVGFLSPSEAVEAVTFAKNEGGRFCLYGGYETADRRCFVALPDWANNAENLNILSAVTVTYRECDKLSHRDFLGALMGLGITRESVGDILCKDGMSVVFLLDDIKPYVLRQLTKVGPFGVNVSDGMPKELPEASTLCYYTQTVASSRLDCIVAALLNTSRNKAAAFIEEKCVSVNSLTVEKCTKNICEGDNITVRGKGKFLIDELRDITKKGRTVLKYGKYV